MSEEFVEKIAESLTEHVRQKDWQKARTDFSVLCSQTVRATQDKATDTRAVYDAIERCFSILHSEHAPLQPTLQSGSDFAKATYGLIGVLSHVLVQRNFTKSPRATRPR